MTKDEIEKAKDLIVKCDNCYYYNLRHDVLVYKSVCLKCKMLNNTTKLKYALSTKFEPNEKWLNAVRFLINKNKQEK
jgi:hypothetical protein